MVNFLAWRGTPDHNWTVKLIVLYELDYLHPKKKKEK